MSYILDALRKSEQERQRGRVPDLSSYQSTPEPEKGRTNIWPWVAGVAVVVNLVVALLVWAPWRTQPTMAGTGAGAGQPPMMRPPFPGPSPAEGTRPPAPGPETAATQRAPVSGPQPAATQRAPLQLPAERRPDPEPVPTTVVDATRKPLAKPLVIRPEESNTAEKPDTGITPQVEEKPQAQEPPPPQVAYMPQLNELPPAERRDVPDMTFSSHMYSSIPRFRSVIINGKRLKEGDYFTDKIQLREITDTGVIMSDGKTLFSVDVLGRWAQ